MKSALLIPFALFSLFAGLLLAPAESRAVEPKKPEKAAARSKLDDALLEGLGDAEDEAIDAEQAKDAKQAKKAPAQDESQSKPPAEKGKARAASEDLDDELLKGLDDGEDIGPGGDKGQVGASDNPFADLSRRMHEVESRIAQTRSDDETQKLQDKIANDLRKLIKELERRKKSSASSSSSSNKDQQTAEREKVNQPETGGAGQQAAGDSQPASDDPAKDSTEDLKNRKSEKPETAQMDEALKDIWGQLPPHLRQQMEQYAKEELLPKYELHIEEYFRALAKGQRERP